MMPIMMIAFGGLLVIGMIAFAFAGPSPERARTRRLASVRERHVEGNVAI